jgi:hypothetical protein
MSERGQGRGRGAAARGGGGGRGASGGNRGRGAGSGGNRGGRDASGQGSSGGNRGGRGGGPFVPDNGNRGRGGRGRGNNGRGGGRRGGRGGGAFKSDEEYKRSQIAQPSEAQVVNCDKFIKGLKRLKDDSEINRHLRNFDSQWKEAWKNAPSLQVQSLQILLEILARLPFSSSIDPPPLPQVRQASLKFLDEKYPRDTEEAIIAARCEIISNLVKVCVHLEGLLFDSFLCCSA